MTEYSESRTSPSLLERVRCRGDERDWNEFYDKYSPRVYRWCSNKGLTNADAEDATQQVFMRLVGAIKKFYYDPAKGTFRGWLRQIAEYAVMDVLRDRSRAKMTGLGDPNVQDRLGNLPDGADFVANFVQLMLIEEAEARLRESANPWHVEAYMLAKEQNKSPEEIAEFLNKTPNAVRVALHRLLRELKRIIAELDGD